MRLHKTSLSRFIIIFGIQTVYAAECPHLTLNDFIQETINIPANPDLPIEVSAPVFFIKKSVLEQNQMEIPTKLDKYPALLALTTDIHSNINLAQVEWNSETKQITCHYEIAEINSSTFNAFDLTTLRKDIPSPTDLTASALNNSDDKFVWRFTHFRNDASKYDGYSCNGYGNPIPVSTCTW